MAFWRGAPVLLTVDGDKLPTEFRLFKAGVNQTRRGDFVFDEAAAVSVMAAYSEHGVDVMIDLEHLSVAAEEVTGDGRNFDPDARGWCQLAVRDGELWAVQVTWTPEGAERLRDKKQRYVSPAFDTDEGRVVELFNIALTAIPATDHTPALVAASTASRGQKMDPKTLAKFVTLLRAGKTHQEAMTLLSIDLKTLQSMGKLLGVESGADLGALIAAVLSFADELSNPQQEPAADPEPAALAEGDDDKPTALADGAAPVEDDDKPVAARGNTSELDLLRADAKKQAAELAVLRKERQERESTERCGLVAELVKLDKEHPATAWVDGDATKPKGSLGTMPLVELRDKVKAFGGVPTPGAAPVPPAAGPGIQLVDTIQISEYELSRLKRHAKRSKADIELAIERYAEIKGQQIAGATQKGDRRLALMVSRPIEEMDVISNVNGRLTQANLVTLSTPVKPIEEFGATSQRALEEFRIEHMGALASMPTVWAEDIGEVLPGGSLKDTFPVDFAVSKYRKKIGASAPARTSNVKEISVEKELYHEAEECELIRLVRGDFAYLKSWQNKAIRMARARQFLRNHLIAGLLETNGTWSPDGVAFFATTHKVDPFNTAREFRGSATWANLQDSAAPLDATALTDEKNLFLYSTPGPDGEEMGYEADGVLYPTILNETLRNLLTVQDLILMGVLGADGSGTMGQERNPHFQSGLSQTRAPELTGTAVTADWYLYSSEGIAAGHVPWVLAEDATEEVRIWDESSDFYKNGTGFIKYESLIYIAGLLVYPHAIRKVAGT